MTDSLLDFPWLLVATFFAVIGVVLIVGGLVAAARVRPLSFLLQAVAGVLLFAFGALLATVAVGTAGYRALTRETTAVQLSVQPLEAQRFRATLRYPDGRTASYELAGDEIYIDAHILKWKPIANMLGLHTAYELDRIAGRYRSLSEENTRPRTVHGLGAEKPVDLFDLRRRYSVLAPLLDAEYGSASFVPANRLAEFDVQITTTGLLIRERAPAGG